MKLADTQYEDKRLEKVNKEGDSWSVTFDDGWSLWIPGTSPIEPKVGMAARLYGKGIGFSVRGIDLDGVEVFYKTAQEQDAEFEQQRIQREQEQRYDFEKNRAAIDKRIRALPEVFQRRFEKFRVNNPDFRWKYEGYELFCCEQAACIAKHVKAEDMNAFRDLDWDNQKVTVPELSDGHSGNTFGCACSLAYLYLTDPESVVKLHGAMAPLVGSEEYGCVPKAGAR